MPETPTRSIRLSDEDWGLLEAHGARCDLTPSELIRRLIRQAFKGEVITLANVRKRATSGAMRSTKETA